MAARRAVRTVIRRKADRSANGRQSHQLNRSFGVYMSFENIAFSIEAGVARLRLDRPAFLNALSRPLLAEFREALDRIAASSEARVLVLSGEGRAFSSGADLSAGSSPAGSADFDAGAVLEDYYNPIMERMFALPVPVVAALHGPVVGAACMLALAADIVVASRSAYFLQAFVNIGLVPDAGSSWWLPRLAGVGRASAMMPLGERIPAEQAAAWGMIYAVVADDELEARAEAIAGKLAIGPTIAYRPSGRRYARGLARTSPLGSRRSGRTSARLAIVAIFRKASPLFAKSGNL